MKQQDPLDLFFDDDARSILFSMVDNLHPEAITDDDSNDLFGPTISAVFNLFDQLMVTNTPDLYLSEWQSVAEAIDNSRKVLPFNRILAELSSQQHSLVMILEDRHCLSRREISYYELSKKIAGFSPITAAAIYYHVQRSLVAKRRGQIYKFPEIKFKG